MSGSQIRGGTLEIMAQRFDENAVATAGKTLQVAQAQAAAQDGQQQQPSGRNVDAAPQALIRYGPELAAQQEIGSGRRAFEHRQEAIPPTAAHADSGGKTAFARPSISPAGETATLTASPAG